MDMWLKLIAAAVGVIAVLVALGLALLGPGRYWGWRLQKVLDQLNGLGDNAQRFAPQRAVLLCEAERLSSKVAAIHKVPSHWPSYITGTVVYGAITTLIWTVPQPELHGLGRRRVLGRQVHGPNVRRSHAWLDWLRILRDEGG